MKLWYKNHAVQWIDALPVGNGKLGAMVYGNPNHETIQLNEECIWSGKPLNRENEDAITVLPEIRRLIAENKIEDAERLAAYGLSGTPNSQRAYQTAGELYMTFFDREPIQDYKRELDLEKGIVKTTYWQGRTKYCREVFVSSKYNVIVVHLTAQGEKKLQFDCHLERAHNNTNEPYRKNKRIGFKADTGADSIRFQVMLSAVEREGNVRDIGEHIVVENTAEATIFISISTSFSCKNLTQYCEDILNSVENKNIDELRKNHIEDYQRLYNRMELKFESDIDCESFPTDYRINRLKEGKDDPQLIALYFQYARYLLISSSRIGSMPANLQGIWNNELQPAWDSKFTININTQMNYWIAESANLSECHLPFFDLLRKIKERGKKTAKVMYGCRGSVAHHNTDLYGDTAPQDYYVPATYWVMGEAWLATHIWERYLYTLDKTFLNENFDVLHQSVLFFSDFLIENKAGELVTSPSVSPENTYIMADGTTGCLCQSATMDIQILSKLFKDYINACKVLGKEELIERADTIYKRLPRCKIGKYGQLQEWMEDYEELEPGHRHFSHLYGVFPGKTINWFDTPELMKAAKISLERRMMHGGGHTGWSRAWTICLYTYFKDAERVYKNLKEQLITHTADSLLGTHPMVQGIVFQIDGNLGAAAGIISMLVQSYEGRVELLPALPKELRSGMVRGVCLYGNSELMMEWIDGVVISFSIKSSCNQQLEILLNKDIIHVDLIKNEQYEWEWGK